MSDEDRRTAIGRRIARRAALPTFAVAAAVALAGCSVSIGERNLDTGDAETEIENGLVEQGIQGPMVDCPDDVEAEDGGEFTCSATASDGSTATILVTQTNDDGNFTWRIAN